MYTCFIIALLSAQLICPETIREREARTEELALEEYPLLVQYPCARILAEATRDYQWDKFDWKWVTTTKTYNGIFETIESHQYYQTPFIAITLDETIFCSKSIKKEIRYDVFKNNRVTEKLQAEFTDGMVVCQQLPKDSYVAYSCTVSPRNVCAYLSLIEQVRLRALAKMDPARYEEKLAVLEQLR